MQLAGEPSWSFFQKPFYVKVMVAEGQADPAIGTYNVWQRSLSARDRFERKWWRAVSVS
jgi:hypothetical protein